MRKFILTYILFAYFMWINHATVSFTAENTFSPTLYGNPNGVPNPNDTTTSLTMVFDTFDGVKNIEDDTYGFQLDLKLPASNGKMVTAIAHVTYTDVIIPRSKRVIEILPQKTVTVTAITRQNRNSGWFVNSGNVQADTNTQGLIDALFGPNQNTTSIRRRLLAMNDEEAVDELERIKTMKLKFFAREQPKWTRQTDQFKKAVDKFAQVASKLDELKDFVQEKVSAARRKVLQNQNDGLPTVVVSPSVINSIDALNEQTGQFLKSQDLAGNGSIAQIGADEIAVMAGVVNKVTSQYAIDLSALTNLSQITGAEFASHQAYTNETQFAQLQALTNIAETVQLLNNRTNYLAAQSITSIHSINTLILAFQTENAPEFNATFSLLQMQNATLNNFGKILKTIATGQQSSYTFSSYLNSKLMSWYTKESPRRAKALKQYETRALLVAAGYKPIQSDESPAQIPLGFIPLSAGNVGYFYEWTLQFTTTQPASGVNFYIDPYMNLVSNYQTTSGPYFNALTTNDANTGGTGRFLHLTKVFAFCNSEYILPLKTQWQSLTDVVTLVGPAGCTANENCNCWLQVKRQRCGTSLTITPGPNYPPVLRQNVWDSNGCVAGIGGGTAETESWFPTDPNSLSGSLTKHLGLETITSSVQFSTELSWLASFSTAETAQLSNISPNPATNTYDKMCYYSELAQSGVVMNTTASCTCIPNNVTLNGIDTIVMMSQTISQGSPTVPYAFFQGMLIAFQVLMSQVGLQWENLLYGGSTIHSSSFTVPYHTPPASACATCSGVSDSGSSLQQIYLDKTAATSPFGVPVYFYQEIGRNQIVTIRIVIPDGRTYNYSYTSADMIDLTPNVHKFLPRTFTRVGFDCDRNHICPSPDPGVIPDGTTFVYDIPRGYITATNLTSARKLDYFADLRPSVNPNLYTLFNPSDPAHSYGPLNPPPVMTADEWIAFYGELKVNPDRISGNSAHMFVRETRVDPLTGQIICLPNPHNNANAASFPDAERCQQEKVEIMTGGIVGSPYTIDEVPITYSRQIYSKTQLTVTFPGTLFAFDGETSDLCPSQQQMHFTAVANSWITLDITNSLSATNINISITTSDLTGGSNTTIFDDNGILTNCNLNITNLILPPAQTYSLSLGKCDVQHIVVQSYGQTFTDNPSLLGYQTCWDFTGSMKEIYNAQVLHSELFSTGTNVSNSVTANIQSAKETQVQIQSMDTAYRLLLFKQAYTVNYGQTQQLIVASAFNNYIYDNIPASTANDTVTGDPIVSMNLNQLSAITSFKEQLLSINNQVVAGVQDSSNQLIALQNQQAQLQSDVTKSISAVYDAAQIASQEYQANLDLQKNISAIEAGLSKSAHDHLTQMILINNRLKAQSDFITRASKEQLDLPPFNGNGLPPFALPDIAKTTEGIESLGAFAMTLFNDIKDIVHAIEKLVDMVLGLLNPNCLLGICHLMEYLMYVVYAVIIIIIICVCCQCSGPIKAMLCPTKRLLR